MAADMIDLLSILPSASRAVSVRFVDQDLDTTTATTALFSTLLLHTTTQQSAISKSVLSLGLWAFNMTTHGAGGIYQWIASTRCPRLNCSKPPARSYRPTGQTDRRTDGRTPYSYTDAHHQKRAGSIIIIISRVLKLLKAYHVDVVSLRYVPDDGTLGCREILHVELKDAQGRADV